MLTGEDKDFINNDENFNKLFVELRGNDPCFTDGEIKKRINKPFERYSKLDRLKRCKVAFCTK